jgi:hypothetical protein
MRLANTPEATPANINIICKAAHAFGLRNAHGNLTNIDLLHKTIYASGLHAQDDPFINPTDWTLVHTARLYHRFKETNFEAS